MYLWKSLFRSCYSCKFYVILLAFLWMLFVSCGVGYGFFYLYGTSFDLVSILITRTTLVGITVCYVLPVLFLCFCRRDIVKPIIFTYLSLRGFSFGFCIQQLIISRSSFGWMLYLFLLLPETVFLTYYLYHVYLMLFDVRRSRLVYYSISLLFLISFQFIYQWYFLPALNVLV